MSASKRSSPRSARASGACLRRIAFVLLGVASFAAAAAGEVYKWKDANGQWHYGDHPPTDQPAEVVAVTPPPKPDPDALPVKGAAPIDGFAATARDERKANAGTGGVKPRSVREVQRGCAAIVNACVGAKKSDTGECLSTVRACAADPTMEKQECCPAACGLRYAELRSQGLPEGLAFTRAVFGVPSCVPGGDSIPELDSRTPKSP